MRHRPLQPGQSLLIYTYSLQARPMALRWLLEPVIDRIFALQTVQRFKRMQHFLRNHADEIRRWQRKRAPASARADSR